MRLPRFLVLLPAASARACTVCDSATGHQVRQGLNNGHLLRTLFAVAAPMPVLFAAVWLLHRAMPDLAEDLVSPHTLPSPEPIA